MKIFSNSFSLGICTSIFSVVTCLLGMLFAKFMKPKNYSRNIKITTTFTVLSLFIMIVNCNMFTVVLFNFCQTISKDLTELINGTNQFNLANLEVIKKEYKVEYFVCGEFSLFIGRTISQALFIMMAFMENTTVMMILFSIFLILYELSAAEFNDGMQNKKENNKFNKAKKLFYVGVQKGSMNNL